MAVTSKPVGHTTLMMRAFAIKSYGLEALPQSLQDTFVRVEYQVAQSVQKMNHFSDKAADTLKKPLTWMQEGLDSIARTPEAKTLTTHLMPVQQDVVQSLQNTQELQQATLTLREDLQEKLKALKDLHQKGDVRHAVTDPIASHIKRSLTQWGKNFTSLELNVSNVGKQLGTIVERGKSAFTTVLSRKMLEGEAMKPSDEVRFKGPQ